MPSKDLDILRHQEWLGLLQPVGLVVSPPALIKAQAVIDRGRLVDLQERLREVLSTEVLHRRKDDGLAWIENFSAFTEKVLGWYPEDLVPAADLPDSLSAVLPSYGETLRPTYGVKDPDSDEWVLLIQEMAPGLPLDEDDPAAVAGQGWKASFQAKFERLLRETGIAAGLLVNGTDIRLVYAPSGESSGYLTFPVQAMSEVPGRLILGALDLLLGADRLFNVPENQRLNRLLVESRNYQAEVSTKLAEQVLDALWELLRGFQAADAAVNGSLVRELSETDSQHIYGGLITTLMRLVFLLYAEDEGLMPDDPVYQQNYAVSGLYEKLREDAGSYPDTMDQRYGAWATLLSLFRLVYDGGGAYEEYLPARHGQLFDPDEYPFLEGRPQGSQYQVYGRVEAPRIPDGTIYRMLDKLLMLDGERLSYRALDVEQIGSVYEAIMGYEVEVAEGRSIAVKPKDVVVNVEALLATPAKDRAKGLKDEAECKVTGKGLTALKQAETVEDIVAALERRVSSRTPNLLSPGSLYLQPGEERRRTGSHYTPRKLTQPIVETTLRPVREALGPHPTPDQILALKVCDLAMGSAAFLVEACRQLAETLVAAWDIHGQPADLPDAVEPVVYARRLVAQRCLYGVDKNPFAVNLAKLSLWLVTLAKDLPFTFVDHALKCGDSLVGISRKEINSFVNNAVYRPTFDDYQKRDQVDQPVAKVRQFRELIQASDALTDEDDAQKRKNQQAAEAACVGVRLAADLMVAAFLEGTTKKDRKEKLEDFATKLLLFEQEFSEENLASQRLSADLAIAAHIEGRTSRQRDERRREFAGKLVAFKEHQIPAYEVLEISERLRTGSKGILPFNWEIEFPEVFDRENPGFDAIVGNPPFMGGSKVSEKYGKSYLTYLLEITPESRGKGDLVAFFLRKAFTLVREKGCLGLITTKTIAQGDTRFTGLRWVRINGGKIYNATKRLRWPGKAAVVVSVIHVTKDIHPRVTNCMDGKSTKVISAYLCEVDIDENPTPLKENKNRVFSGSNINGKGFVLSPEQAEEFINLNAQNSQKIKPYIGGDELNTNPKLLHSRYVIDFGDDEIEQVEVHPELFEHLNQTVRIQRQSSSENRLKEYWWRHSRPARELYTRCKNMRQILASSRHSPYICFGFQNSDRVFSDALTLFAFDQYSGFSVLQSQVHDIWAIFFGSSIGDTFRYIPEDCFETFPFPENWETAPTLEAVGKTYYEYRADLMVRNNQGLTDTYNCFHDPEERHPHILKLRDLHNQMDRAVLNAYGWPDIDTTCGFALDYLDTDPDDLPPEAQDRIVSGDLFFPTPDEAAAFDSLVRTGKRKLPWRYRWPEVTHDEVLARLLDLNQQRYLEEVRGHKAAGTLKKGEKQSARSKQKSPRLQANAPTIPGLEI
ncbi:N-6 DNA methylase [Oscillatoria sp. CS-180]|uniref:Eco57I restriction-modification methylase domain-containing protein n=1 Tax=Oscillatoria sp. CS-180 TaxID=3021720 RepID=UPI00232EFC15|nr:type IIL restriction-modification enzyme MmeI [Oscillatoria sp. CS-180]MDB9529594.1 N-6 DNA methylase [Oscillatoria sp. CS-180]